MAFHSTAIIFILFYFAGVNYGKLLRFIFVLVTLILTPDIIIEVSLFLVQFLPEDLSFMLNTYLTGFRTLIETHNSGLYFYTLQFLLIYIVFLDKKNQINQYF